MKDYIIEWIGLVVFVVLLLAIVAMVSSYRCDARWAGSHMRTEWRPIVGCQLETTPGTWIPDDQYRHIP